MDSRVEKGHCHHKLHECHSPNLLIAIYLIHSLLHYNQLSNYEVLEVACNVF